MGIFNLLKQVESLTVQNKELNEQIKHKDDRIAQLETLCEEKDAFFDDMIADGLRHGSSKAAQQMAYKKDYLKNKK